MTDPRAVTGGGAAEAEVEQAAERFLAASCANSPANASYYGVADYDLVLAEPGEAAVEEFAGVLHSLVDEIGRPVPDEVDVDATTEARRVALAGMCAGALLDLEAVQSWRTNPSYYLDELIWSFYAPLGREDVPARQRATALRSRLDQVPDFLDAARQAASDVPALFADVAIEMATTTRSLFSKILPGWAAREAPGAGMAEPSVRAAHALEDHIAWLAAEHRGGSRRFEVGAEVFERLVGASHAMTLGVDGIVAVGRTMLDEVNAEIEELAASGFGRPWQEALGQVKADQPAPGTLLDGYRHEVDRARELTIAHRLASVPDAELDVVATPEPFRALVPYASYVASPAFGRSDRGLFWVTPADDGLSASDAAGRLAGHCRAAMTLTTVHEAYPGHHLQRSAANCLPGTLARIADSPMLIEGWAFYCEELAWEAGYYDERTRLHQLSDQLWRAARVIIDAELHTGRMSLAEAARALVDWAGLEDAAARAEVRRYAMKPTRQMAYALGRREIVQLRSQVRAAQGPGFSPGAFHDDLLSFGAIPVPLIAQALLSPARQGMAPTKDPSRPATPWRVARQPGS